MVFEKHFTLNKNLKGPDHHFSLNPKEMKIYVKKIHEAFLRLGSHKIIPSKIEMQFKDKVRIGVMVNKNLFVGDKLSNKDIKFQKIVQEFYLKISVHFMVKKLLEI